MNELLKYNITTYKTNQLKFRNTLFLVGIILSVLTYFLINYDIGEAFFLYKDNQYDSKNIAIIGATSILMLVFWSFEVIALPITSLLPIVIFPVLDICSFGDISKSYSSSTILMIFAGFILASAIRQYDLHKRIVLFLLSKTFINQKILVLQIMFFGAFLSMFISNTATIFIMLPIVLGIIDFFKNVENKNFNISILLGSAFAISIGSFSTLIGTPPNMSLINILNDFEVKISGLTWFYFAFPISLILVIICWFILSFGFFKFTSNGAFSFKNTIKQEIYKIGSMKYEEKILIALFNVLIFCWIFLDLLLALLDIKIDQLNTILPILAVVILFIIPNKNSEKMLSWNDVKNEIPWGIILLFGGGLALSSQFNASGFSYYLADKLLYFSSFGIISSLVIFLFFVLFVTQFISNTATAAALIPVSIALASSLNLNEHYILLFAIPTTLIATCAFCLPIATPPNSIVFASEQIKVKDFIKAGGVMSLISVVVIVLSILTYGFYLFDLKY